MRRTSLLLLLLPLVRTASVDDTFASCFHRTTRRSIDNSAPIAEFTRTTAVQCMRECVLAASNSDPIVCRAFTYERLTKKCQLYDHDGSELPAVLFPANDIDLFVRTSTQGACGGSLATHPYYHARNRENFHVLTASSEEIVHEERSTVHDNKNDITGWSKDTMPTEVRETPVFRGNPPEKKVQSKHVSQRPRIKVPPSEIGLNQEHRSRANAVPTHPKRVMGETAAKKTTQPPKRKSESEKSRILQKEAQKCSNGEGYYVVLGNQIIAPAHLREATKSFEKVEQGECARLCTENKTPKGDKFACKSINYYPSKRRCEMFSILSEPHGPGNLLENRHSIYAEKFCISEIADDCEAEEVFILHVQKTLLTKAEETMRGDSISSCLDRCFSRRFCRSVVFDSAKKECALHADSPGDARNNVKDTTPGVVLIENGCRRSAKPIELPKSRGLSRKARKNSGIRRAPGGTVEDGDEEVSPSVESADWGEWSECNFKSEGKRFQVRTRNCDEDNAECKQQAIELKEC